MCRFLLWIGILTCLSKGPLLAQQEPDTSFQVHLATKSFPNNDGPIVAIDEGHYNFHTIDGRYQTFAWILRKDGYQVKGHKGEFTNKGLREIDVLVIVNAIHKRNRQDWSLPNPSAFTKAEIDVVEAWVRAGGKLFLIADHMPFPGAAHQLASRFGFEMTNSFAFDKRKRNPEIFVRADSSLIGNSITNGTATGQRIDTVVTFTGQGFHIPAEATPVLSLTDEYVLALPEARQNIQLLLNIANWLALR